MYLVNTLSVNIEHFSGDVDVQYAILSHRWESEEVSLQEMRDGSAMGKAGYQKIVKACRKALDDGLDYLWIDTCCIDKDSSAELSEAINSMFTWYRKAQVCYAYLSDVHDESDLEASVWFTRGWTLQELLAPPPNMVFYKSDWQSLGTKRHLKHRLSNIAGIPAAILMGDDFSRLPVAQRMSWAANRVTSRKEDLAYSLMGIFDINMALLYGEGEKAFIRLQEEIIRHSDDQSIFAWELSDKHTSGLLAPSPNCFWKCSDVHHVHEPLNRDPFTITNKGLSLRLKMIPWALDTYLALLDCGIMEAGAFGTFGIFIRSSSEPDQYTRIRHSEMDHLIVDIGRPEDHENLRRIRELEVHRYFTRRHHQIKSDRSDEASLSDMSSLVSIGPSLDGARYRYWNEVPKYMRAEAVAKHVFVRQKGLEDSSLSSKPLAFTLRKFAPYGSKKTFDWKSNAHVRSWSAWGPKNRVFFKPDGHAGPVCVIYAVPENPFPGDPFLEHPPPKPRRTLRNLFAWPRVSTGEVDVLPSFQLKLGFVEDFSPACYYEASPEKRVGNSRTEPGNLNWLRDCESLRELALHDWTTPVRYFAIGSQHSDFEVREGSHRIYFKKHISASEVTWVVDLIYVAANEICSECEALILGVRFYCLDCVHFVCCLSCFVILDATHTSREAGDKKHIFRVTTVEKKDINIHRDFPQLKSTGRLEGV